MAPESFSRPRTPGRSPPPQDSEPLPPVPEDASRAPLPARRSSFGFLRRSKSGDLGSRKTSGGKLRRKQSVEQREQEEQLRRQREAAKSPPRLPDIYNGAPPSSLDAFGGEKTVDQPWRASVDTYGADAKGRVPIPPIPGSSSRGKMSEPVDPYARTESMTHRGRYSYASSAISTINSPRRVRRRKDPTPFNILVIGAQNSGKTSFLEFLRTSLAPKKRSPPSANDLLPHSQPRNRDQHPTFTSQYIETSIDGENVGLTLWDSQGLETNVVDLQLRDILSFLESKFEDTFAEEMKVIRAPGVQDTHIHCVFLILDPVRIEANVKAARTKQAGTRTGMNGNHQAPTISGLAEDLDLQVFRALQGKTTVVPVISKADSTTKAQMAYLKTAVWDGLKMAGLDPLEALGLDDEDEVEDEEEERGVELEDTSAAATTAALEPNTSNGDGSSSDSSMLIKQSNTEDVEPAATATGAAPATSTSPASHPTIGPTSAPTSSNPQISVPASSAKAMSTNTPYLPLSIISPDLYDPGTAGRRFPWGFADPYNEEHCDFVRLKNAVFREWRGELREASRELWYEGWRGERLRNRSKR
ncbi:MAG: hypothetical protein M1817_001452 [Caeruleum heppii]|nr:MAG: hypothetical protein M1817_001452 [Caeruleum heppii]